MGERSAVSMTISFWLFMLTYVVVWVENPRDVFGKVAVQHRLDVVPMVDCSRD